MPTQRWFDRTFELDLPLDSFAAVRERVRGTPARLEERLRGVAAELLTGRRGGTWSLLENAGHLGDLEPLWAGRLDDLLSGKSDLRPADLENHATEEANHDARDLETVLATFRRAREETVARLDVLGGGELERRALHPRLKQPMGVTDLFFFVAEHDDHHLVRITELILGA